MLTETLLALVHVPSAKCESASEETKPIYHPFRKPKLQQFMIDNATARKSHYNCIHDSLPYRTDNETQLKLYDQYMNDVTTLIVSPHPLNLNISAQSLL